MEEETIQILENGEYENKEIHPKFYTHKSMTTIKNENENTVEYNDDVYFGNSGLSVKY